MSFKINFQGMEHSLALENHAREKVEKMSKFLGTNKNPASFEFHLKSHANHAHQEATVQVKTDHFRISSNSESKDMYLSIDDVTEKLIGLIKKENEKIRESRHQASNKNLDVDVERFSDIDLDDEENDLI